ncbi:hypothetical protein ACS0TY_002010 [Phlomoides rotata]
MTRTIWRKNGNENGERKMHQCMHLVEHQFTWSRGRGSTHLVEERLDRAMGTSAWHGRFPDAKLLNHVAPVSDHNPILLRMETTPMHCKHRQIHFENRWLHEKDIPTIIRRS